MFLCAFYACYICCSFVCDSELVLCVYFNVVLMCMFLEFCVLCTCLMVSFICVLIGECHVCVSRRVQCVFVDSLRVCF